jgi:DNA-directed RNA polymerase specialized sigma24 family protein
VYDLSYSDARPWLYGIATNLAAQHRRDEARQFRIRQAAVADPEVPGTLNEWPVTGTC